MTKNGNGNGDWNKITTDEAYRLSQAEFKGMTIQALRDIQNDISDIKNQNNMTRYISMFIAGIAGIVSGVLGGRLRI